MKSYTFVEFQCGKVNVKKVQLTHFKRVHVQQPLGVTHKSMPCPFRCVFLLPSFLLFRYESNTHLTFLHDVSQIIGI